MADKVGKQNIISAVVHREEKTPHMHLSFCPITKDNRLSAKDILEIKKLVFSFWKMHIEKAIEEMNVVNAEKRSAREKCPDIFHFCSALCQVHLL